MFEFKNPLNIGPNKYMCLQENCAKDENSFLSKDDGKAKLDKFFKELIWILEVSDLYGSRMLHLFFLVLFEWMDVKGRQVR